MKNIIIIIVLFLFACNCWGYNKPGKDSVGIYLTESDFFHNKLSYENNVLPKSSFFRNIPREIEPCVCYGAGKQIEFKIGDSIWKKFGPHSMFGFCVNGHKYVYNKGFSEFRQVICFPHFYFYPGTYQRRYQSSRLLYFAKTIEGNPVLFNKKDILKSGEYASTIKVLLRLYHALVIPLSYSITAKPCYNDYIDTIRAYMAKLNTESIGIYRTKSDFFHNHLSCQSFTLPKSYFFLFIQI